VACTVANGESRETMAELYKQHKVFVNASASERFGLTILEGLAAGCRVLATIHSRGLEWLPGIQVIDPLNHEQMRSQVSKALLSERWNYEPNNIARKMTWEKAAEQYKEIYEQL
jgi:glycosyltransferase involved in cell wall biosynthesis